MLIGIALAVLPLLIFLIWSFGPLDATPYQRGSGLAVEMTPGPFPGIASIEDTETGVSYALGVTATRELFSGRLPLWNPYEGFGAPLLGEMVSAALFPPTWLLPLPHGLILEHCLLQFIAGLGTFLFLRRFGLGLVACLAGGIAFELNGVFSWLHNAIFNPVAFLPWLLYGIERIRTDVAATDGPVLRFPAIAIMALAGALAIYAGFPEEVYLYSYFIFVWAVFRSVSISNARRLRLALGIVVAAALTLALSAPALVTFAGFLPEATAAQHTGEGFYGQTLSRATALQFLLPYVYGPPFAAPDPFVQGSIWGPMGGYLGLTPFVLGLGGLAVSRRRSAKLVLAAWVVVAVGVTQGTPVIYQAFMALPLMKLVATYRYLNASWIFAVIFLAALAIDDMTVLDKTARRKICVVGVAGGFAAVAGLAATMFSGLALFIAALPLNYTSVMWSASAAAVVCVCTLFIAFAAGNARGPLLCGLMLITEGLTWYLLPYLTHPQSVVLDMAPLEYLQKNIGLQRFARAPDGAPNPNFGALFGAPMLNYIDIPVPARSVDYIKRELYPDAADVFLPMHPPVTPERQAARDETFQRNLAAYAQVGVKYVVSTPQFNIDRRSAGEEPLQVAFQGRRYTVYEVPHPRDYFSADGCTLTPLSRTRVAAHCARPSRLLRLEVFMRGWTARVDGRPSPMDLTDDTFQTVALPAGKSVISFRYWPPGFTFAITAWAAALALLNWLGVLNPIRLRSVPATRLKAAFWQPE